MCVCVPSNVAVWCSGLCSRVPVETSRVRSPPSAVTHVFLLLLYLWVEKAKCVCLSMHGRQKNCWPKTATGSCVVQDQALPQWWSIRSACNLIGGAILARSTMLAHSRAIITYGDGRPRSKVQGLPIAYFTHMGWYHAWVTLPCITVFYTYWTLPCFCTLYACGTVNLHFLHAADMGAYLRLIKLAVASLNVSLSAKISWCKHSKHTRE